MSERDIPPSGHQCFCCGHWINRGEDGDHNCLGPKEVIPIRLQPYEWPPEGYATQVFKLIETPDPARWSIRDSGATEVFRMNAEEINALSADGFCVCVNGANLKASLSAHLLVSRYEMENCADHRARRRLISEKLQPLGDALLAAMEQIVAEKADV